MNRNPVTPLDQSTLNTLTTAMHWISECDMQIHTMRLPPGYDEIIAEVDVQKHEKQLYDAFMKQLEEWGMSGTDTDVWGLISMLELYASVFSK